MEYCLDGNRGEECQFTAEERNILIRYCLSIATRAKCSTKALLRPFRQKYLKEAFAEQGKEHTERIAQYERAMKEYDPQTTKLPQWVRDFFEGVPTKEEYARYCRQIIKQEKDVLRSLKRSYSVQVDYAFVGRKLLAFHNSLNPRATFGYSNCLHEECDFVLDEEKRKAFLDSSLAELPQHEFDWIHDWGNVAFGGVSLIYEDLTLFRGDVRVLETISHEQMMTVRLDEADLSALALNKDGENLTKKLSKSKKR